MNNAPGRFSMSKRKPGRPVVTVANIPRSFLKLYPKYRDGHITISQYATLAGVSRPTVYKYIRLLQEKEKENK